MYQSRYAHTLSRASLLLSQRRQQQKLLKRCTFPVILDCETRRSEQQQQQQQQQQHAYPTTHAIRRTYASTAMLQQSTTTVPITYVAPDGTESTVQAEIGKNLLTIAHDNDIELEGACGGELACSTCHLIFEKEIYDKLPEKEEEEDDMLDLAFEVTETSRLGCQIPVTKDLAGIKVRIPDDGF